jgi:hypothetical protein
MVRAQRDPEAWYEQGSILSYCGKEDVALRLIGGAIAHNYCATAALKADPLLVRIRGTPEFNQLVSASADCQKRFLAQ